MQNDILCQILLSGSISSGVVGDCWTVTKKNESSKKPKARPSASSEEPVLSVTDDIISGSFLKDDISNPDLSKVQQSPIQADVRSVLLATPIQVTDSASAFMIPRWEFTRSVPTADREKDNSTTVCSSTTTHLRIVGTGRHWIDNQIPMTMISAPARMSTPLVSSPLKALPMAGIGPPVGYQHGAYNYGN